MKRTAGTLVLMTTLLLSMSATADDQITEEIQTQVIDQMAALYSADPNEGSRNIFDKLWLQSENILFFSEQFVQPFYGYGPVASYWKPSWNTLYGYREIYSDLRVTSLAPNIALATLNLRYDMHAVTRTPLAGVSRLTLVMRKVNDRWKIQQYYETPMSLISQGRLIHEEMLDPGFTEFARSQNPQYDELVEADENIKARKEGVPWVPRPRFRPPVWKTKSDSKQN